MPVALRARLLPVLVRVAAPVLVAALLPAAPAAASGRPAGHAAGQDCAPHPDHDLRVRPGGQVAEPAAAEGDRDLLADLAGPQSRTAAPAVTPPGSIAVPTYVHVIAAGPTRAQGYLTRAEVDRQLTALDQAFAGTSGTGAVATPFRFRRMGVTWTVDKAWYDLQPGQAVERQAKSALRRGDDTALNIYLTGLGGGLFGYAYQPARDDRYRPWRDGVVVSNRTIPGGGERDYEQGDTLAHEVGHWFGLYHTFHGACTELGDRVGDTPRERYETYGCPAGKDTCAAPGSDPVHNFMDYSFDRCMYTFTPGQAARMDAVWKGFRAGPR